ncbi:DNA mismatch repair protein MutT [Streptomyces sulfonofaciens]|uniref:8-oxo-dGTP diphosphatase n=1 Tax=Streptomyces sulfonofaciens TaxID=68272 RepID=A0A919GC96_9ACTN|nr:(deoxy)nucleoside triphosphate pyrophosphohydrolase [Streptomyces sulfonofaciens]GHH81315.1 DNA mismatch repair protein MutT [Streptomyces sulfonofaciens]
MTERIVVAAALLDRGRLLAARRSAPPELAGRWELPGGKVEAGEVPEQALVRELREELGVEARPLERISGSWPLAPGWTLQVWTARLVTGEPRPLQDHDALRWLAPADLWHVPWLDQDVPAVREAARHAWPPEPTAPPAPPEAPAPPSRTGRRLPGQHLGRAEPF